MVRTPPYTGDHPICIRQNDHIVVDFRIGRKRKKNREIDAKRHNVTNIFVRLVTNPFNILPANLKNNSGK